MNFYGKTYDLYIPYIKLIVSYPTDHSRNVFGKRLCRSFAAGKNLCLCTKVMDNCHRDIDIIGRLAKI